MGRSASGFTDLGLPGIWFDTIEIDYNDVASTQSIAIRPYTHVLDVLVNITTAWTAATTSAVSVGDSSGATSYLATAGAPAIVMTTAGIVKASANTEANAHGAWYSAADQIDFAYAPDGTDAAGQLYGLAYGAYFGNASSGAMMTQVQ